MKFLLENKQKASDKDAFLGTCSFFCDSKKGTNILVTIKLHKRLL